MAQPTTLASEQVADHGQVEPALAGRNVGDIRQPDLIGPVRDKILLEQVLGGFDKMATAFFKMSRSLHSRSFSRRSQEISAAGSGAECGADAGIVCRADPASRPPLPLCQLRSIEGECPARLRSG
jgi:hypothetical protein